MDLHIKAWNSTFNKNLVIYTIHAMIKLLYQEVFSSEEWSLILIWKDIKISIDNRSRIMMILYLVSSRCCIKLFSLNISQIQSINTYLVSDMINYQYPCFRYNKVPYFTTLEWGRALEWDKIFFSFRWIIYNIQYMLMIYMIIFFHMLYAQEVFSIFI